MLPICQRVKYLGQKVTSFESYRPHRRTQTPTECSIWTTKIVGTKHAS